MVTQQWRVNDVRL